MWCFSEPRAERRHLLAPSPAIWGRAIPGIQGTETNFSELRQEPSPGLSPLHPGVTHRDQCGAQETCVKVLMYLEPCCRAFSGAGPGSSSLTPTLTGL